jgi:hypothetical protein
MMVSYKGDGLGDVQIAYKIPDASNWVAKTPPPASENPLA